MTDYAKDSDNEGQRNLTAVRTGLEAWASGTGSPFDLLTDDAIWESHRQLRCSRRLSDPRRVP